MCGVHFLDIAPPPIFLSSNLEFVLVELMDSQRHPIFLVVLSCGKVSHVNMSFVGSLLTLFSSFIYLRIYHLKS